MKKYLEIIKKLCLTPGISGKELYSGISQEIFSIVKNINKNTIIDKHGDVISILGNGNKKIMIDAHLDEVGFSVSKKNNGKIQLTSIGNINIQKIDNSEAFVLNKNIKGKIIQDTSDIIFETENPKLQEKINSGDIISFSRYFSTDQKTIKATALDNRIGCACLIYLIDNLKNNIEDDLKIIFTFTSGEEKDKSILDKIATEHDVDFGIIVDAAYAKPVSFGTDNMSIPELGKGCAIQYIGLNFIVNKNIINTIEKCASREKISFQKEIPLPNLGRTNFSKFQQTGKTGCVINIPVKNQHEQISEASIKDFDSASNLIMLVIEMFRNGKF